MNEVKSEILCVSGLATTAALIAVENRILDVNTFVKKADYAATISELKKIFYHFCHNKFMNNALDTKTKEKT